MTEQEARRQTDSLHVCHNPLQIITMIVPPKQVIGICFWVWWAVLLGILILVSEQQHVEAFSSTFPGRTRGNFRRLRRNSWFYSPESFVQGSSSNEIIDQKHEKPPSLSKSNNSNEHNSNTGLYVHIPYCRRRCRYCNFSIVPIGTKVKTEAELELNNENGSGGLSSSSLDSATLGFFEMDQSYRNSLLEEISVLGRQISNTNNGHDHPFLLKSVYFGGGTPSLAPLATIRTILEALLGHNHSNQQKPLFSLVENAELTIEMDPGTFSLAKLQALKQMGLNRISLGVQSFDDEILASIGRVHRRKDVFEAVEMLHRVFGADVNYSLDLISGLPGLSLALWAETLHMAVSLYPKPRHISLYDLQIEQGTVFGKWFEGVEGENEKRDDDENGITVTNNSPSKNTRGSAPASPSVGELPTEEDSAFMYKYAAGYLKARGFEHYEVSSYAYVGDDKDQKGQQALQARNRKCNRSQHNQIYWDTEGQWYALGLGATSFVNGKLAARPKRMVDYQRWVQEQASNTPGTATGKDLNPDDFLTDVIMKRLRTADGLDLGWIRERYGKEILDCVLRGAELGLELDLMTLVEGDGNTQILRLKDSEGFLYSNNLISSIFVELGDFQD